MLSSYIALKKVEAISFYGAGRNYLAIGDFENGVEQLRRAIKQSSSTIPLGDAFLYLCIALPSLGEEVEPTLKEALQTFPEHPELAICRLVIDTMSPQVSVRERAQEKVDFFKGYVDEKIPKLIALFYHNIGHGLYIQENFEQAILTYSRALEFEPERATTLHSLALALSHLGNEYANLGLHQNSELTFLRAIEIRPNLPLAHFGLTSLYLSLNDRDRSKTHYEILRGLDHNLAGKLSTFF